MHDPALLPWLPGSRLTRHEAEWIEAQRQGGSPHAVMEPGLAALDGRANDVSLEGILEFLEQAYKDGTKAERGGDFWRALGAYGMGLRVSLASFGENELVTLKFLRGAATALRHCDALQSALDLQRLLVAALMRANVPRYEVLFAQATLAQIMLESGGVHDAYTLQQALIEEAERAFGKNDRLTRSLRNDIAGTMLQLDQVQLAEKMSASISASPDGGKPEELMLKLVASSNHASALYAQGHYEACLEVEERNLASLTQFLGRQDWRTLIAANNLALTLVRLGKTERADELLTYVADAARRADGLSSQISVTASDSLLRLLMETGELERAIRLVRVLLQHLPSLTGLGTLAFRLAARCALCVTEAVSSPGRNQSVIHAGLCAFDQLAEVSVALCEAGEVQDRSVNPLLWDAFAEFHNAWSKIALMHYADRLGQTVAPLHGLESWSTVIELLCAVNGESGSNERTELREARDALRRVRARIELRGIDSRLNFAASEAMNEADEMEAERRALDCYRHARARLLVTDASLAGLDFGNVHRGAARLSELLEAGEALVLTVPLSMPGRSVTFAQILLPTGECAAVPLPQLADLVSGNGMDAASDPWSNSAYRGIGIGRPQTSLQEFRNTVKAAFWDPVLNVLGDADKAQGLTRIHVVTAPSHHGIPLECANPGVIVQYCHGLPAFIAQRTGARRIPRLSATRILTDAALGTVRPIPFVHAELRIAEVILGCEKPVDRLKADEVARQKQAQRFVFSCHGEASGFGEQRHGTLLLDASADRHLSFEEAVVIGRCATEIIVSACVAGQVGRGKRGDAIGTVAVWQLMGVPAIISCVAPVPDFYMPLLLALYAHQRVSLESPARSLQLAKLQLQTGHWPTELLSLLREIYREQMDSILRDVVRGRSLDNALAVLHWPLPSDKKSLLRAAIVRASDNGDAARGWQPPWSDPAERALWVDACLCALIDGRIDRPTSQDQVQLEIHKALEHVCAFSVCYGAL